MEIFSVCFDKILFVSVVSIPVRNTETKRENMYFGFAKQIEKQPKKIEFRFVSVRNKKYLIVSSTPYSIFSAARYPALITLSGV
jgi:hypothetical protein